MDRPGLSSTQIIKTGDNGLSFFLQQEKAGSKPLDKLLPFPSRLFAKRKGLL